MPRGPRGTHRLWAPRCDLLPLQKKERVVGAPADCSASRELNCRVEPQPHYEVIAWETDPQLVQEFLGKLSPKVGTATGGPVAVPVFELPGAAPLSGAGELLTKCRRLVYLGEPPFKRLRRIALALQFSDEVTLPDTIRLD